MVVHVDNVGLLGGDGETWEEESYETEPDGPHIYRGERGLGLKFQ